MKSILRVPLMCYLYLTKEIAFKGIFEFSFGFEEVEFWHRRHDAPKLLRRMYKYSFK